MQEVATGKYHGHSFGGLNEVPPTDEIGRSDLSVRRTDATITVGLLLALSGHHNRLNQCLLLGVKGTSNGSASMSALMTQSGRE